MSYAIRKVITVVERMDESVQARMMWHDIIQVAQGLTSAHSDDMIRHELIERMEKRGADPTQNVW